ncbi:MAG: Cyclic di-GMP phosphodiesterase Gmr [Acidimicrobiaceae bacterium]|nr:Cyclic di-GMP phosphodiesterase Gmr [Acidimicrobiaceae bacterium]
MAVANTNEHVDDRPVVGLDGWRGVAPGRGLDGRRVRSRRDEMELLAALTDAVRAHPAVDVLPVACELLAELFGAVSCRVVVLGDDGRLTERACAPPDGLSAITAVERERQHEALAPLVEQVLRHGDVRQAWWPATGVARRPFERDATGALALAAPLDDRAVMVLELGVRPSCADDVQLVAIAAALVSDAARDERRLKEHTQQEVIAAAMRQLLETGIRAGSPIEAAAALASTAARVLDFPVACAYLVDDAGRISEVVTVGARPGRGEALRARLVGELAAGSPVWRRTVEGPEAGPNLIADTTALGVVRAGGVAQVLGLRSLATIPLLSSDGPLGVVLCGDTEPRSQWQRGVRELLAQLALEGTVVVDNARLREAERHEASHDSLTGLLNRRAFSDQLRRALESSGQSGVPAAVLLLDLDRFKEVNDYLGHHRGDVLLVDVADRLRTSVRDGDVLARLGGDEFALLLTTGASRAGTEAVAVKIAEIMDTPFEVGEHLLHIEASIGVASFPDHAADADALLQRADLAMYAAKRSGRGHEHYDPTVADRDADDLGLLGELRRAVHEPSELLLHFQPKIDLRTGAVTGAEALVRWMHPRQGLLGPDRFVPLAEETGLVRALTAWVVPEALQQLQTWREAGLDLSVAVNISARDVDDRELPAKVADWLSACGLDGTKLVLEVTERTVMTERASTIDALQRLRELGVKVSLDDFGTGYSSLAYLESLPVDEIKIDQQFLRLGRSRRSVIRSIIALGHDLDMRVVAEGVETAEHAQWLARMGCDEAQGHHFSPPLDPQAFALWMADDADDVYIVRPNLD